MPHQQFMQRCIALAQNASGFTSPNPMVGAVLVHNGNIISEGWHHYYGAAHAEVNCLDNLPAALKHLIPEATMYVNLEPCAHYGLTPPCANRLVAEKVQRVVIANTDPFAEVNGKGIAILRQNNIEVVTGVQQQEGYWLNRRFFAFHTRKRPYIILKWAQTPDGFIGTPNKGPVRITGAECQTLSHKWRTQESAIMVGFTTALNDDPQLTARLHTGKQPLRIAIDRNKLIPHTHNLHNIDAATWIVNETDETVLGNVHYIKVSFDDALLNALLARMYDARLLSVIVEGGAHLLESFIAAGLWDEARIFTGGPALNEGVAAPILNGGTTAFSTSVGQDLLQVQTNPASGFVYPVGADL